MYLRNDVGVSLLLVYKLDPETGIHKCNKLFCSDGESVDCCTLCYDIYTECLN